MKTYRGFINELPNPKHVFVFGSNLLGNHGGGAAFTAKKNFGARMGQAQGLQGKAYAIPTCDGEINLLPLDEIQEYVSRFLDFVRAHSDMTFFLTPIGTGIAGANPDDIAETFRSGIALPNLIFPEAFLERLAGAEQIEIIQAPEETI